MSVYDSYNYIYVVLFLWGFHPSKLKAAQVEENQDQLKVSALDVRDKRALLDGGAAQRIGFVRRLMPRSGLCRRAR